MKDYLSWITTDTGRSIPNIHNSIRNPFTVYLIDDRGYAWKEENYKGFGVFGGKSVFELIAEMNGTTGIEMGLLLLASGEKIRMPNIVERLTFWRDVDLIDCEHQGYDYPGPDTNPPPLPYARFFEGRSTPPPHALIRPSTKVMVQAFDMVAFDGVHIEVNKAHEARMHYDRNIEILQSAAISNNDFLEFRNKALFRYKKSLKAAIIAPDQLHNYQIIEDNF